MKRDLTVLALAAAIAAGVAWLRPGRQGRPGPSGPMCRCGCTHPSFWDQRPQTYPSFPGPQVTSATPDTGINTSGVNTSVTVP